MVKELVNGARVLASTQIHIEYIEFECLKMKSKVS